MNATGMISASALALMVGLGVMALDSPQAQTRVETQRAIPMPSSGTQREARNKKGEIGIAKSTSENNFGCLIQPHTSAEVAASAPGILSEVRVRRGDRVKKGQILAVLDNDVEQALLNAAAARATARSEIAAARATRDMASKKLRRMSALNELSYGAKLELELAEGELKVSQYRIEQAKDRHRIANREHQVAARQLDQRFVRSPIDGVVADRLVNPGERADGRPIARVIKLDQLRIEVVMPADQYGMITEGMFGTVETKTAEPITITAIIDQVDSFIDPASGTFRARMLFDNRDLSVPAGAQCRVTFETQRTDRTTG